MDQLYLWKGIAVTEFLIILAVAIAVIFSIWINQIEIDVMDADISYSDSLKKKNIEIPGRQHWTLMDRDIPEIERTTESSIEAQVRYICEYLYPDVSPEIVLGIIYAESRFTPDVIDDSGSYFGLMQIGPRWHADRMERLGVTDLLDPYSNILVGVDYLNELLQTLEDSSMESVLRAYRGVYDPTYFTTVLSFAYDVTQGVN